MLKFPSFRDLEFEINRVREYNNRHSVTPGSSFYRIVYKRLKVEKTSFRDDIHLELPEYKMQFYDDIVFSSFVKVDGEEQDLSKYGMKSARPNITIRPALPILYDVGLIRQDAPDGLVQFLGVPGDRFVHGDMLWEVINWKKMYEFSNLFIPLYYEISGKLVAPVSYKVPENVTDYPEKDRSDSEFTRDYIVS